MHLLTKWGLGAVHLSILAQLGLEIRFVVAIHLSSGRVSSNHVSQGCRLLNKKLMGSSVGKMGKIFD